MKIVVFGTGYVGSAIVRELAERGHEVTAVSRTGKTDLPAPVASVAGSVHDPAFLASATVNADVTFATPAKISFSSNSTPGVSTITPGAHGK